MVLLFVMRSFEELLSLSYFRIIFLGDGGNIKDFFLTSVVVVVVVVVAVKDESSSNFSDNTSKRFLSAPLLVLRFPTFISSLENLCSGEERGEMGLSREVEPDRAFFLVAVAENSVAGMDIE
jgi:hypothetical protein